MTSKQRAYLKSLAMTMDPILQLWKRHQSERPKSNPNGVNGITFVIPRIFIS